MRRTKQRDWLVSRNYINIIFDFFVFLELANICSVERELLELASIASQQFPVSARI